MSNLKSNGSGEMAGYDVKTGLPSGAPNAGAKHEGNVRTTATGGKAPAGEGNRSQTGLGSGTGPTKATLPAGGSGGNETASGKTVGLERFPEGNLPMTAQPKPFKLG